MQEIVECVTNISEGRNRKTIAQIKHAIESGPKTKLLHVDSGYDANRTVFTFIGDLNSLQLSVTAMFQCALESIDMTKHNGKHPRIGAIDVCPFIPIHGITPAKLNSWVHTLAHDISKTFSLPIYMYEDSAKDQYRKNLESIRKGGYETLSDKLSDSAWQPDYGPTTGWERTGATVMGVRKFLLAYNINLKTTDVNLAKSIAIKIRGSGYMKNGQSFPGLFPSVKAIGWYIEEFGFAQVSTNLTNYHDCSFHQVYDACKDFAKQKGVDVVGSELIGLSPKEPFILAAHHYGTHKNDEKTLINLAVKELGLSSITPFNPTERIIENLM